MNQDFNKKDYISNKIQNYYKNKSKQEKIKNKIKTKIYNELINNHIENAKKGGFYNINKNLNTRIYDVFKEKNIQFKLCYETLIGCSVDELEIHITKQFVDGMSIDNYGEWEIDHIIPISSYDFTNKKQLYECFNYKNLQPLWKPDNRLKSNKIIYDYQIARLNKNKY